MRLLFTLMIITLTPRHTLFTLIDLFIDYFLIILRRH